MCPLSISYNTQTWCPNELMISETVSDDLQKTSNALGEDEMSYPNPCEGIGSLLQQGAA